MATPHIAEKHNVLVELEAGKTYKWCACGLSSKQPFCDGSHKRDGEFSPVIFTAEETKSVRYCLCKQTQNPNGFCDGTHKAL